MKLLAYLLLISSTDALKIDINDEDDSLMEMVDTNRQPWTGDKCTYNIRRLEDKTQVSTWNQYKNSEKKWYD
jgi:hypothetical protein